MTTRKPKTAEMEKMSELLPGGYSLSFSVDSETADQRIDRTVADAFPELSRSRIQHMAENGCITVNGKIVGKSLSQKQTMKCLFISNLLRTIRRSRKIFRLI